MRAEGPVRATGYVPERFKVCPVKAKGNDVRARTKVRAFQLLKRDSPVVVCRLAICQEEDSRPVDAVGRLLEGVDVVLKAFAERPECGAVVSA
jgi:hypothetical protein